MEAATAKLTDKQQQFVNEYLKDSNATQAAIRAGYSEKTAKQIGSRLLTNVDVAAAVAQRKERAAEKADLTLETHLAALNDLRDKAATANQYSAAVSAEVSRGKASGFYVDRAETKHSGRVEVVVRIAREGRRVTAG